jgi:hypothetical protein
MAFPLLNPEYSYACQHCPAMQSDLARHGAQIEGLQTAQATTAGRLDKLLFLMLLTLATSTCGLVLELLKKA